MRNKSALVIAFENTKYKDVTYFNMNSHVVVRKNPLNMLITFVFIFI